MHPIGQLRRMARHHRQAADLAVAVIVFAATLLTTARGPATGHGRLTLSAVLVAAAACAPLAARRYHPLPVLAVSAAGAEVYVAHFHEQAGTLVLLAPLIALYTLADVTDHRRTGLAVGGFAVLGIAGTHTLIKPVWLGTENLALAALGALAVAAGDSSRNRRAYLAEAEQRAARAEHDRDQDTRRRLVEERLRIARDLHDSVGHHLALISVQAGVADRTLDAAPDQAHLALAHVRTASRNALGELRDTIGLLREPGEPAAPTRPTAGLDGLDELVASFRRSGLRVRREVDGRARPLAPAADLTAYRVIQESLTNVCKHAGAPDTRLRLSYGPGSLHITVDDDGRRRPPAQAATGGHGIVGMRERVAAVGGSLEAGPRSGGGFRVSATLPLEGAPA